MKRNKQKRALSVLLTFLLLLTALPAAAFAGSQGEAETATTVDNTYVYDAETGILALSIYMQSPTVEPIGVTCQLEYDAAKLTPTDKKTAKDYDVKATATTIRNAFALGDDFDGAGFSMTNIRALKDADSNTGVIEMMATTMDGMHSIAAKQEYGTLYFKVAEKAAGAFYTEEELKGFLDSQSIRWATTAMMDRLTPSKASGALWISDGEAVSVYCNPQDKYIENGIVATITGRPMEKPALVFPGSDKRPSAPVLTLSNGGTLMIKADWTKPADNGKPLSGYNLYVSTDAACNGNYVTGYGPKTISGADTLSELIGSETALQDKTTYYVKVAAVNAEGETASPIQSFTALNVQNAATPKITVADAVVNGEYGSAATVGVSATVSDGGELTYQWYRSSDISGADGEAAAGATQPSYTTPVLNKTGETFYYYCEVTNTNNKDAAIDQTGGSHVTKAKSDVITVNAVKKALNAAGITVNEKASIYTNGKVELGTLLTMSETAGAVSGETLAQVLDLAAADMTGKIVFKTEKTTTSAVTGGTAQTTTYMAIVPVEEVVKTAGTYIYEAAIPVEGSSTNYALSGPIEGKGTLTVAKKSSGGGGGGGGGGSSSGSGTTAGTEVKKDLPSSGSVTISSSEMKNAKSVEVKNSQITVSLNQSAVNSLDKATGLLIKAEKKSGTTLNDAAKELLGSRPVFDVTATQNGKAVTEFGSGKITISIAYAPTGSEDTAKLFLYYINDKGEAEKVSGSKYDGSLKAVTGQTGHLSSYAVGYDKDAAGTTTPVTPGSTGLFRDVSSSDWFYTAVLNLAGKEILSGVPDEDANGNPTGTYQFRPQANVTRAEFATMLAKAAGANLSQYSAKTFNDVSADDWYAGAVGWASSVGVASGTGDGNFSPNANITRQDMAVMISKYAANVAKTTLTAKNEKITFTDGAQIADYAKSAVESMQTGGIISGTPNEDAKGNSIGTYQFRPFANASRAEAAAMLNGLLSAQ